VPDVQQILEALASPIRREILWLVWGDELTAGAIASAFHLSAPTISSHLAVLRDAGLVTVVRDGNFRRYRADQTALRRVSATFLPKTLKWNPVHVVEPAGAGTSKISCAVRVGIDVPVKPTTAFRAFTDAAVFSAWLGSEVTLRNRRFTCALPWGRVVRGFYDIVVEPELIAMRWDFDSGAVPVPGSEMIGYLRFRPKAHGTHVEAQQLIDTQEHAVFMQRVWSWVLGNFEASHRRPARAVRA
jgi:DNA-binding transcriptional ArsR family regulator/uncharacterized protein YndB with AHSA1/START domain